MSDDGESKRIGRRKLVVYLAVCFLVGAAGVAGAAHLANSVYVDGGVSIGTPDGLYVTVEGQTQMDLSDPTTLSGTANIVTEDGNATFYSPGQANATIHKDDIVGTWTNVTNVDADTNTIQIDPADKQQVTVGKDIDHVAWRDGTQADDGVVDFTYGGASGLSRVTLNNVSANVDLLAVDASTGNILDSATSDSSGTITFDELDNSDHAVLLQSDDTTAPTLSNPAPTGDLAQEPNDISIQVNDSDFQGGDAVDVTIDLDGSQIHSETISANQTVTASIPSSGKTGGDHSWSVDATDDFGNTATDSNSYRVPTNITFREEEPGHDIIQGSGTSTITVEAIFFEDIDEDPTIINRTTTDGTIDLSGLPVSSEFSVAVQAPGYHNRTVRVESIFEQNNVFLINRNRSTIENRFAVSDRTGNFPPEDTQLIVQAPINQSHYDTGGIDWKNVAGDDLGADEAFVTDLIEENRYRIVVTNDDGDRRILGAYTAEATGTINLNIGSVELVPEDPNGVAVRASYSNETGTPQVRVDYNDTANSTERLWVKIYERNNESNTLVANQSFTGPYGQFSYTKNVPAGENDTTWVVEVVGDRGDNATIEYARQVGPGAAVLTGLPSYVVTILFVGLIWGVAGMFSQLNGHVGGIVVAGLGAMLYFVGLVPGFLGGGVVALSLITAGIMFIRESRGGGL